MPDKSATEFDYERCKTSRPTLYVLIIGLALQTWSCPGSMKKDLNDLKAMQPCRTTEVAK